MERFWNKKIIVLFVIAVLLLIIQIINLLELRNSKFDQVRNLNSEEINQQNIITGTQEDYQVVFNSSAKFDSTPLASISGGILPHHLLVKEQIASYLLGLADQDYDTIVLVGPNHQNLGNGNILVSDNDWQTPTGNLSVDLDLLKLLAANSKVNNQVLKNESSIVALLPYLSYVLPQSQIVPIIIKESSTTAELSAIAKILANYSQQKKILVLSSVDFSHYLPVAVADFHDQLTANLIQNFDLERILKAEVDSPQSLYLLLDYLRLTGQQKSYLVKQTNSGRLLPSQSEATTSHQFYYFTEGQPLATKYLGLLFFGDLMLDRNVSKQYSGNNVEILLEKLSGQENRFWRGLDLVGANLEGAVIAKGEHWLPDNAYDFSFDPLTVERLKKLNFNFFTLANNHLTDQGVKGVKKTRENLERLNFEFSGCADAQVDQCSYRSIERAGYHLGMLGFSQVYQPLDLTKVMALVTQAKGSNDLVVVNIHWGNEYQHQKNDIQKNIAYSLIDNGADVIIGHHPHVVQGMEKYQGKYIFYSLGNFVFDQYFSEDTQEGLGVGLIIDPKVSNPVLNYYLFPIKSEQSKVRLMNKEEEKSFLQKYELW